MQTVRRWEPWCFEPSQPLGIISGLKETFTKRYIVERTNKTEIRSEKQSEKAESCRENLWNEIQLEGPKRQTETEEKNNKKEWAISVGLCQTYVSPTDCVCGGGGRGKESE